MRIPQVEDDAKFLVVRVYVPLFCPRLKYVQEITVKNL